jgi:hypothetical protein
VSFFLKWLRPETSSRIGMRPHQNVELALSIDAAFDRVLHMLDRELGANISVDDRKTHFIEATFGLVKSERLRIYFETIDDAHTLVRIEAYYQAGMTIAEKSMAVETLAKALEKS